MSTAGVDKGVFAWLAVNYKLAALGYARGETTGIVHLGGADMQVQSCIFAYLIS